MTRTYRLLIGLCGVLLLCSAGAPSVFADGETAQITNVFPTGAISPGTSVSFAVSTSGFVDPAYAVSDSFSASGATVGSIDKIGYFTWTPGVYDAGTHAITVTVTDAAKHSATASATILVSGNSVIINNFLPGPSVAVNRPVTFTLSAPGFITPSYYVYDSYAGSSLLSSAINSSGAFSWTPRSDDVGNHLFTIIASDIYGHNGQTTKSITVTNPTVSIQSLQPGSGAGVGSLVSFLVVGAYFASSTTYSISDSFNGTTTIAASNLSTKGAFTWTPTASDLGTHTITVTATDIYGNTGSASTQIVITTAPPTTLTPAVAPISSTTPAPSTPSVTTNSSSYRFTTNLAIGSRSTAVTELQKRLTALGFYTGPITGYYGALTATAVKAFQGAHGLARVGYVGPGTRAALNN